MTRRPFHRRLGRAFRALSRELRQPVARSFFSGAGTNRLLLDWIAAAKSADDEIRGDLRKLRARARELARNNSYVKRYLRLLVANVIGPAGIKLQALIRGKDGKLDTETNAKIEAAWLEWSRGLVTLDGKLSLRPFEGLLLRTLATDGEICVRFWRGVTTNRSGLALQPIDVDLLDERFNREARSGSNEIRLGVEVDSVGAPVAYHFWDKPSTAMATIARKRYRVPADEIVHIYLPDRVNQTRGVTWLHSVMVAAHMLDAYEETEAIASRVASAKMGFFEKVDPSIGASLAAEGSTAKMQAAPGSFEILEDGYAFKEFAPTHPTSQFGAFIKQMGRKIASGVSIFSNVLLNDASDVNYSSFRAFALIMRDDWRQVQEDVIDWWRRPLYAEWIKLALLTGALKLASRNPAGYMAVRHRPRGWSAIDPEKEAKGAALALANQLTSRTSILAEQGIDFEDILAEIKGETELAATYGVTLSAETPVAEPATKDDVEAIAEDRGNGDGSGVVTATAAPGTT